LVAAGLVFWLRSVLGTRHGDERERPNPYLQGEQTGDKKPGIPGQIEEKPFSAEDRIHALAQNKTGNVSVENKTAENGLLDISKADKKFDVNHFLSGAQDAFAYIVEAFAQGDTETLKGLLTEGVYGAFEEAIKARGERGESMVSEIHAIKKAEITGANMMGRRATITVRFTAEETSVTRNRDGEIIEGNPDKVTQMRDVWTFGREINSKDPRWLVYETRDDLEDDNATIPNKTID
jgi:predicted lipid-binding transport protein (Tim44 family)